LQIHIRDFEGNANLRHKLLTNKSGMIVNWIAFTFAQHLIGHYETAFIAIKSAELLISKDTQNPIKKVEMNEFKLY
jgi:peptide alpha-N-acetyltransferase